MAADDGCGTGLLLLLESRNGEEELPILRELLSLGQARPAPGAEDENSAGENVAGSLDELPEVVVTRGNGDAADQAPEGAACGRNVAGEASEAAVQQTLEKADRVSGTTELDVTSGTRAAPGGKTSEAIVTNGDEAQRPLKEADDGTASVLVDGGNEVQLQEPETVVADSGAGAVVQRVLSKPEGAHDEEARRNQQGAEEECSAPRIAGNASEDEATETQTPPEASGVPNVPGEEGHPIQQKSDKGSATAEVNNPADGVKEAEANGDPKAEENMVEHGSSAVRSAADKASAGDVAEAEANPGAGSALQEPSERHAILQKGEVRPAPKIGGVAAEASEERVKAEATQAGPEAKSDPAKLPDEQRRAIQHDEGTSARADGAPAAKPSGSEVNRALATSQEAEAPEDVHPAIADSAAAATSAEDQTGSNEARATTNECDAEGTSRARDGVVTAQSAQAASDAQATPGAIGGTTAEEEDATDTSSTAEDAVAGKCSNEPPAASGNAEETLHTEPENRTDTARASAGTDVQPETGSKPESCSHASSNEDDRSADRLEQPRPNDGSISASATSEGSEKEDNSGSSGDDANQIKGTDPPGANDVPASVSGSSSHFSLPSAEKGEAGEGAHTRASTSRSSSTYSSSHSSSGSAGPPSPRTDTARLAAPVNEATRLPRAAGKPVAAEPTASNLPPSPPLRGKPPATGGSSRRAQPRAPGGGSRGGVAGGERKSPAAQPSPRGTRAAAAAHAPASRGKPAGDTRQLDPAGAAKSSPRNEPAVKGKPAGDNRHPDPTGAAKSSPRNAPAPSGRDAAADGPASQSGPGGAKAPQKPKPRLPTGPPGPAATATTAAAVPSPSHPPAAGVARSRSYPRSFIGSRAGGHNTSAVTLPGKRGADPASRKSPGFTPAPPVGEQPCWGHLAASKRVRSWVTVSRNGPVYGVHDPPIYWVRGHVTRRAGAAAADEAGRAGKRVAAPARQPEPAARKEPPRRVHGSPRRRPGAAAARRFASLLSPARPGRAGKVQGPLLPWISGNYAPAPPPSADQIRFVNERFAAGRALADTAYGGGDPFLPDLAPRPAASPPSSSSSKASCNEPQAPARCAAAGDDRQPPPTSSSVHSSEHEPKHQPAPESPSTGTHRSRDSGSRDSGSRDSGSRDSGSRDSGSRDSGSRDSGSRDSGSRDKGGRDKGGRDKSSGDGGSRDNSESPPPKSSGSVSPARSAGLSVSASGSDSDESMSGYSEGI
ncbi:hypothetical protein DIPPA_08658 [Diplonema papillatum]|nr:hypothetical protein DIPPA_08658 [Diplonema papillatum]